MTNCGAPGCRNRSTDSTNKGSDKDKEKQRESDNKISFHKLPTEKRPSIRAEWLKNIKRQFVPKSLYICSEHFEKSCFKRDLRAELVPGAKPRCELHDDAVPTIFEHKTLPKKRKLSLDRQEKSAKQSLLNDIFKQKEIASKMTNASTDTSDLISNRVKDFGVQVKIAASKAKVKQTKKTVAKDDKLFVPKKQQVDKIKITNPKLRSKGKEIGTMTDISFHQDAEVTMTLSKTSTDTEIETEESQDENVRKGNESDFSYRPSDDSGSSEEEGHKKSNFHPVPNSKFIVYWSCLLTLLETCRFCLKPTTIERFFRKGSKIVIEVVCAMKHRFTWESQPNEHGMAAGNISLAASILLSGGTFERQRDIMNISNITFISHTTYYRIQKKLLVPAIHHVFLTQRQLVYDEVTTYKTVNILGDGRCDSPGYNAKYGTYTIMDERTGRIIDLHVSHVALTVNSSRMELDGLKNVFRRLDENGIKVTSLTTDRHKQVRKYMREQRKDTKHQFDIWHVSKNIKKNLCKYAKKKCCAELKYWIKSIINHFWWSCATCNGDATLLKEKWLSILNHIKNEHEWEGNEQFHECLHKELTLYQMKTKPWLKESSYAYAVVQRIATDKNLLSDIPYLTKFSHTGGLEVYHSLYNKYCPKRLHFSYDGMVARSQLAVLDFNTGVGLEQARNKKGEPRHKHQFSKITQSWVGKKIAVKKDKTPYRDHIMDEIRDLQRKRVTYERPLANVTVPAHIATVEKPDKNETIKNLKSRFPQKEK